VRFATISLMTHANADPKRAEHVNGTNTSMQSSRILLKDSRIVGDMK
jgi:hypothetical protein